VQVCHDWNTARHLQESEGRPQRRALSRREVQDLLDYADSRVEEAVARHRKGVLAAYRDATLLKVLYGWGLRCQEASRLDLPDFHANPKAPSLGRFGFVTVRYGKGSRGSGPRSRPVASLMPWAVVALQDFVDNVRPRQRYADERTAVWLTERGGRVEPRWIEERFKQYATVLGLPGELTPHCLRHSYVSHLIEDGVDPAFVQQQVGHRYASTLGVYTHVSEEHMSNKIAEALAPAFIDASTGGEIPR
jgi:integrase/recombinase XerC